MTSLLKPGDFLIISVLALAAGFSAVLFQGEAAGTAVIYADGEFQGAYPLRSDCHVDVQGPLGLTTVAIENGKARILSSPCPNQLCVHMGTISQGHSTVVCVPNRVMVSIPAKKGKDKDIDAVTQ